jgi:hypothetical protein
LSNAQAVLATEEMANSKRQNILTAAIKDIVPAMKDYYWASKLSYMDVAH